MADHEICTAVTMDDEVKHDAAVKDGCQITNVHINDKFLIHEDVLNCENKIHNTDTVRVKVDVNDDAARDSVAAAVELVGGTDNEAQKIETFTLLSLETQSLASGPYQCESVGLNDKFLSAEANLTETREEEGEQCKAETCQIEETGELNQGKSESTDTHESMEDESKRAETHEAKEPELMEVKSKSAEIQQTEEFEAIDEDTCDHAVESGEMKEDQSESECAVAEIIKKIEECENAEIHETEESEVGGGHSDFAEINKVEDDMKGSDEVKAQSNEDKEVKHTDEVRDEDNDEDKQVGEVTGKINEKDEEIKHGDEVKNQNIEKIVNSKKRTLNEIDSDLQTHSEDSQSAAFNMFKKKRKTNKMKERDCGEGQEREPCSHPVIIDSNHQMQPMESTTVGKATCLLESSLELPRPPTPSQCASNLRTSPYCGPSPVIETLQSGPGRPPIRQKMEPHMGPPMQLMGAHIAFNGPGPDMGPPEPGIGSSGANIDSLEISGSGRRSLGMSPQSQVLEKEEQAEVVEKKVEPKPGQKPVYKPRAVATTPIPGTVWCVVRTDDGKCFFYDPSKRCSVWKRPEELQNRPDVDQLLSTNPEVKTETVDVRDVQEEPPSKKIRSEVEVKEVTEESNHEVTQQIILGEEAAMLPEVEASQHSSVVPLEVSRSLLAEEDVKNDFMKMLGEIPGINHHTIWSDVESKVSSDPRYKAVVSDSEREDLFREYLKTVNDVVKNDFMKKLSEIPGICNSTTWRDVKSKVSSHPELLSYSHRNNWLREYFKILIEVKNDFMKKLSEIPGIKYPSTTWSDVKSKVSSDPQFEALFSDSHREDWFREYLKNLNLNYVKNYFMARLNKLPFINNSTTWHDVKTKVGSQYTALLSDYHRENWFKEYLLILNNVKNDFMARLIELPSINNSTTWNDVKTKVSKHPQYKPFLNDSRQEDWFKEYLQFLNDVKNDFMKRLSETPGIKNNTTWSDVKKIMDSFPDYEAFFSNSHLENWFREHLKTLNDMKKDFMKILSETPPGIDHWTSLCNIKSKVSSDPRYKTLVSDSYHEDWFREYWETLNDVKNDFMKKLSEIPDINHSTTWNDVKSKVCSYDPRYEALVSDSHQEYWFWEYLKILNDAKSDFMKRLSEIHSISIKSTWIDVESKMNLNSPYNAFVSDFHREDWFREYLEILIDKIERDKKRYVTPAEFKRMKIQREEVLQDFKQFIGEKITDPGCSFWTFKSICERDFKLTNVITGQEMQHLFASHIDKLTKRKQEMVKDDFMKMLSEIPDINLSTTWSDVKCKVSSDPRYEAVVSVSHQEDWFREYLKNQNDIVKNDFMKQLSEIPGIKLSTTWNDVKSKVSSDPRNEALVSDSHRKCWFREYLKTQHDMVKNDFMEKLSEIPGINCSTTWSDVKSKVSSDPHYEAFVNDSHREDWIQEYVKTVNDMKKDFMKILSETPGINHFTTWSYIKSKVSSHPQSKSFVSDSHREEWFKEYLKTLNDARNNFMKKLSEIPGIENSITWRDVENKVNSDARYEALFSNFHRENWFMEYINILKFVKLHLMESLSKIPGITSSTTWSDVKSKVSSDPLYEAVVSDSQREDWFRGYLKILNNAKNNFMERLNKMPGINHSTAWSDVKSKVISYETLVSDSHREDWFKEYLENDVKNDFMKMLSKIPDINHCTSWSDVERKVSSDPRYKAVASDSQREEWFREYLKKLYDMVKNHFMKKLSEIPGINCSTTLSDVKSKVSSNTHYDAFVSDSHREDWIQEYFKIVNNESVVETIGEDMDTAKDDLNLQCRSPYSDISDRSMSDKSEDEQKLMIEMEEVSSDEDIEPDEKEIEKAAVKTFPPSVHESVLNDSRIKSQSVVSSLEGISLVTTQFSSVTIPNDGNSLTDIKRSSRAAPFSLSDNEDRTSQHSNRAISNHQSLPQEREKFIKYGIKDSASKDGEKDSPKQPVDVMGEMELEPVSDEDSPLDNLSTDGEKEEGEEKVSDREEDRSSLVNFFVSPSKTSDIVSKDDETSNEGQTKSDPDESAKTAEEEKEGMANNRKPVELVDFGEAERRVKGSRPFYPEAQQDRGRSSRGLTSSSRPPSATSSGVYTSCTSIHSQYSSGVQYSLSHEAISSSHMGSPRAAVYDGGESKTSSHSRSSVPLRDDVPPPYPIDGVKQKHHSPASNQESSIYKSSLSSVSSSSHYHSSPSTRSRSHSQSGSQSSSSSQRKKCLKSSKHRSVDTEKALSQKSETSTSKLSVSERIVSPMSEAPSIPVMSQPRERHLSSIHESISSDELPYFPDEDSPKSSPKVTSSISADKLEESTGVEAIISENHIVPVTLSHHTVEGSKDVGAIISEDVIVPMSLSHHTEEENKDFGAIISEDVIVPVTLSNHTVEGSKDFGAIILEDVIVPVKLLHHTVEGSKDVETVISEDVIVPMTDLRDNWEEGTGVERIISENVVVPVTLSHHKVDGNKDLGTAISEGVIVPVTLSHHKVDGNKDVGAVISENVI